MSINNNKLASQKMVKGQIADASGHTDFLGTVDQAVDTIIDQVATAGKWVYISGNPFIFNNVKDPFERDALRDALLREENPEFILTGTLQGGAVKRTVTKSPVSASLNSRNRPQMAIVFNSKGGVDTVNVITSNYKGGRRKLAKYREQILSQVRQALQG